MELISKKIKEFFCFILGHAYLCIYRARAKTTASGETQSEYTTWYCARCEYQIWRRHWVTEEGAK